MKLLALRGKTPDGRYIVSNIIINNKERFHTEKDQILATGLKISGHINVDDTGARHNGANGYCTHIGNDLFARFKSTETKSRINFLKLLQGQHNDFIIKDAAIEYMNQQSLPMYQLIKLATVCLPLNESGNYSYSKTASAKSIIRKLRLKQL